MEEPQKRNKFGQEFISLARNVYKLNDEEQKEIYDKH